jgi:hypothetical protein
MTADAAPPSTPPGWGRGAFRNQWLQSHVLGNA